MESTFLKYQGKKYHMELGSKQVVAVEDVFKAFPSNGDESYYVYRHYTPEGVLVTKQPIGYWDTTDSFFIPNGNRGIPGS